MRRPRTSTLVLAGIFVATLLLYLAVRPDTPTPAPSPSFREQVRQVIAESTSPDPSTEAPPATEDTTSTTEAPADDESTTTSTTEGDGDGTSTTSTTAEDGGGRSTEGRTTSTTAGGGG